MQTSPRGEGGGHNRQRSDNETGPVLPRADASKTEILSSAKANAHANLLSLSLFHIGWPNYMLFDPPCVNSIYFTYLPIRNSLTLFYVRPN